MTFMKIKQWIQNKRESQKGFTLLFAVLVSTLVVAIGATVVSIALRQTILSGTSRESQYAFYAANTALECAFYWDVVGVAGDDGAVFPYDFGSELVQDGVTNTSAITCAGGNIVSGTGFEGDSFAYADGGWNQGTNTTTFKIEISDHTDDLAHRYCAEVTVTKTEDDDVITTVIQAKGYNTCDLDSPRAVERGLVQSYES